jgi:hypothetical protein
MKKTDLLPVAVRLWSAVLVIVGGMSNGIKKLHGLRFGVSFLVRAISIAILCLILLLFANSQARAEGPVSIGPQIDIYVGDGPQNLTCQGCPHSFVAFDSIHNRFLVVWHDEQIYADFNVYGQMVNADGTLYGNPIPISTASGSSQMGPMPVFNPITGRFLVVWNDTRGGVWGPIYYPQVEIVH